MLSGAVGGAGDLNCSPPRLRVLKMNPIIQEIIVKTAFRFLLFIIPIFPVVTLFLNERLLHGQNDLALLGLVPNKSPETDRPRPTPP